MDLSIKNNIWELKNVNEKNSLYLSQTKNISSTMSDLLSLRGITPDNYDEFINPSLKNQMPDPSVLKDCDKAAIIIADAIEKKEKIIVYGDYDVDGGTSTAVLVKFLKQINSPVDFYIPNKLTEGYGPNVEAFKKIEQEGGKLIITVDCGISAFKPIEESNIKVVVIDHHMAEEKMPNATAIVNPKRLDDESNLGYLAGVGVTFLTCVAVNRELKKRVFFSDNNPCPNLMPLLDLVALGTVCDVMKLKDFNRVLVSQGLKILNKKLNCGLRAMADLLEINKQMDTYHLGFVFGPRINAGGRLGYPKLATSLLISEDYNEALELAKQLNDLNETRKGIESKIYEEALDYLSEKVIDGKLKSNNSFVYNPDWHSGVLGIVASRLKEKFNKPSFAVACEDGVAHGSGRSITGVDLGSIIVLGKQKGILKDGGGHKMAAGFSCDIDKLEDFKHFLEEQIHEQTKGKELIKTISIDSLLSIQSANLKTLEQIKMMAPFGNGNPKPKFQINGAVIGKTMILKDKHIKCFLSSPLTKGTLEGIIFNAVDSKIGDFLLNSKDEISLIGSLDKNCWNGRETVQFLIEDAK